MATFVKYTERYLNGSRQRITQRIEPCTCGCEGKDSWHAMHLRRVVREIETFDTPYHSNTADGCTINVCAVGRYKHPAGWMPCGLEIYRVSDGWICGSWYKLQPLDYGEPEAVVEEGEYVPWARRPENQKYFSKE